jgi:RNase P/RNase MRP subunit p29
MKIEEQQMKKFHPKHQLPKSNNLSSWKPKYKSFLFSGQQRALAARLLQQLLIGEQVTVLDYYQTPKEARLQGTIVNETKNMLCLLTPLQLIAIPKQRAAIIVFDKITEQNYLIEGRLLQGRVEDRLKATIRKMW